MKQFVLFFLFLVFATSVTSRSYVRSKGKHGRKKNSIDVDYLIIGGGPGGLTTAMDFGESLKAIGKMEEDSVLILEASDRIGGRHEYIEVIQPDGYNGPTLKTGVGARRYEPTYATSRRMFEENKVPTYCVPFNNHQLARGQSSRCELPSSDGCSIYGDFCTNDLVEMDVFNLEGDSSAYDDPENAAYEFIMGQSNINPATGEECNNEDPSPAKRCAIEACKSYGDYSSFLRAVIGNEYAEMINLGNAGYFGDQGFPSNACRTLEYIIRDWDTTSITCYAEGGWEALNKKILERVLAAGAKIMYNEPAIRIDENDRESKYIVSTPNYKINVHKFLFLAINTFDINGKIDGSFVDFLQSQKAFNLPGPSPVVGVSVQWDPNTRPWFLDLIDKTGGTYNYRVFGDKDCFSMMEFIDTPYERQQNVMKAVYSDYRCINMWRELIEAADSGNPEPLKNRVLNAIRSTFPLLYIPEPVLIIGKIWGAAWYGGNSLNDTPNEELISFASKPHPRKDVCLIGDAYDLAVTGWTDAAYQASRNCLLENFPSDLTEELESRYLERDNLIKPFNYGAPNTANFTLGTYEHFPPFTCLYNEDGTFKTQFTSNANCGPPSCSG